MSGRTITSIVLLLSAAMALSACGRDGRPLKPSEAAAIEAKKNNQPAPEKPVSNSNNPEKSFILDGLLN